MMEATLSTMGFKRLQEKENVIYYEKQMDEETCYLMFDKQKKKIKSVDVYRIEQGEMKVVHQDPYWVKEMKRYVK